MSAQKPKPEQGSDGRFLSGNIGGGRPKGSRNKIAEDFLKAMADDFEEHGAAAIAKVRGTKPEVYLRVVADLLPAQLTIDAPRRYVARLPEPLASSDDWLRQCAPASKGGRNAH